MDFTDDVDGSPAKRPREENSETVGKQSILDVVREGFKKQEKISEDILKNVQEIIHKSQNQLISEIKPPEKEFVMRETFSNVSTLMEGRLGVRGKKKEHFGAKWFIRVVLKNGYLMGIMNCEKEQDLVIQSTDNVKLIVNDSFEIIQSKESKYEEEICRNAFEELIPWDQMVNSLVNNQLTIEYRVKINKTNGIGKKNLRSFDSPSYLTNVALKVGDEKFHVSKECLAIQSSFFNTLFFNPRFEEHGKKEVYLKDFDPYDFQNYLEVVYGENGIQDDTVEGILLIADAYNTKNVVKRCEEFLLQKSKKKLKKLFDMAVQYKLDDLTAHCISNIKDVDEYDKAVEGNLENLDKSVSAALIKKSIELMRNT